MARVKYYDQASQEWKYADAALNMKGKDGYTPQKGIDYFTEEDVRELTENVLDQGVLTYNEQELTEDQKAQARENIGIDQISFDKLTENLDADGFRITNLPLPQSGSEPATKEFVENFTIEGSTYVATDDGEGNVTIRPYSADEDELVFKSHIQNQNNPHGVTAAQVGARPSSWIPTATEVGAATPEAVSTAKMEAIDESKAYAIQQVKTSRPYNLLDNSDFRNPVNQKGEQSYAGKVYGIDRWTGQASRSHVSIEDGCIRISPNPANTSETSAIPFCQHIVVDASNRGKTVTLAAKVKGTGMRLYIQGITSTGSYVNSEDWDILTYTTTIPTNSDTHYFGLQGKNAGDFRCEWIALYEGEYTKETLPEYQSKGYEQELLICRQYDPSTGEYIGLRKFSQPWNLLDNSDFKNLVAQAGINVRHGEILYFADRWENHGYSLAYDKNTRIITFSSEGASILKQTIGANVAGKTVTLAIKASEVTDGVYLSETDVQSGHKDINIQNGITTHTFVCGDSTGVIVWSNTAGSICIDWIALYEGEYTAETLPEYQSKGYGVELVECQRYYQIIKNGVGSVRTNEDKILVTLPLCVSMRNAISVAEATIATVRASGLRIDNPEFEVTAVAYNDYNSACVIELGGTFTGMGNGIAYIDGRFHLCADIL